MSTLFISDLHLCSERPQATLRFFSFLEHEAAAADALYVLGDLFESWVGDDDLGDPFNASVVAALAALTARGVPAFFMPGNRDFLIGAEFARASGVQLLPDPTRVNLHGVPTLLMHGDALCTLDHAYQTFRREVRSADWIRDLLRRPLAQRKAAAAELRRRSEQEKQAKSAEIMDVTADAVAASLRLHAYPRLIHGHTHRPARHLHAVDGHACERWVLADWYEQASYLECDARGCRAVTLTDGN